MLYIKFDSSQPDGGTTGHAPHKVSLIDWEFETHLQIFVLYKKAL